MDAAAPAVRGRWASKEAWPGGNPVLKAKAHFVDDATGQPACATLKHISSLRGEEPRRASFLCTWGPLVAERDHLCGACRRLRDLDAVCRCGICRVEVSHPVLSIDRGRYLDTIRARDDARRRLSDPAKVAGVIIAKTDHGRSRRATFWYETDRQLVCLPDGDTTPILVSLITGNVETQPGRVPWMLSKPTLARLRRHARAAGWRPPDLRPDMRKPDGASA